MNLLVDNEKYRQSDCQVSLSRTHQQYKCINSVGKCIAPISVTSVHTQTPQKYFYVGYIVKTEKRESHFLRCIGSDFAVYHFHFAMNSLTFVSSVLFIKPMKRLIFCVGWFLIFYFIRFLPSLLHRNPGKLKGKASFWESLQSYNQWVFNTYNAIGLYLTSHRFW